MWLFIMLSLSNQHIIFLDCFYLCIVLQASIGTFLIRDIRMLQAFLCHHQITFFSCINYHLSPLTSSLNLPPKPLSPPGTSSPLKFQQASLSIKSHLFLMTLFKAILLNRATQYTLIFNISADTILFFLFYLKFRSNTSGTLIH